jgi:membrane associated rhomboid family serine protease
MIPLYDDVRTQRFPFFTAVLIALCAAMFAGWQMQVGLRASVLAGGLSPAELQTPDPSRGIAHLFTYMFLHGGWMHLLGNMWFLWVFGRRVEEDMGSFRFLIFYLLCGAAAALGHACFSRNAAPLVGASGAISGVLGAYLILHPRARIATLIPMVICIRVTPIPAFLFLLIWIAMQAAAQIFMPASWTAGVAYLTHLGGFFFGLGWMALFRSRPPRKS